jgi:hypothetical protein
MPEYYFFAMHPCDDVRMDAAHAPNTLAKRLSSTYAGKRSISGLAAKIFSPSEISCFDPSTGWLDNLKRRSQ